jgi:hypothetical protein
MRIATPIRINPQKLMYCKKACHAREKLRALYKEITYFHALIFTNLVRITAYYGLRRISGRI